MLDFVRGVLSNLKAAYLKATASQRADLLHALFEKVTLEDGKVRTHLRGFLFNHVAGDLETQCRMASPTGTAASWIALDGVTDYLRAA